MSYGQTSVCRYLPLRTLACQTHRTSRSGKSASIVGSFSYRQPKRRQRNLARGDDPRPRHHGESAGVHPCQPRPHPCRPELCRASGGSTDGVADRHRLAPRYGSAVATMTYLLPTVPSFPASPRRPCGRSWSGCAGLGPQGWPDDCMTLGHIRAGSLYEWGRVYGQLLKVPDDPELWLRMDCVRGVRPEDPADCSAGVLPGRAADGSDAVECWVYVYNGDLAGGGNWPTACGGRTRGTTRTERRPVP